jgi:cytochrome c oxidase subunit 2
MFESFATVTPQGSAIRDLFVIALAISAVILLVVYGVLAYVLGRYRGRPGDPEPPQVTGNRRLEVIWTVTPALILLVMFLLSVRTMRVVNTPAPPLAGAAPVEGASWDGVGGGGRGGADPPGDAGSPQRVQVIGHQWWWELRYPDLGVLTANELHAPVGAPLSLEVTGADVVHSFWVPQLGWKRDAIPGKTNVIGVRVDVPGTYDGACAEFCGVQHAWMRIRFVAQSPGDFQSWVQQQEQVPPPPALPAGPAGAPPATQTGQTSLVTRGQLVFLGNTCVNCHRVAGTAANGTVGPDLTHFGSRATIGAGVVENTPANLAAWVHDAKAVKPGVLMPPFALTADDVAALVAYLEGLK